jgi:hypothetical protein
MPPQDLACEQQPKLDLVRRHWSFPRRAPGHPRTGQSSGRWCWRWPATTRLGYRRIHVNPTAQLRPLKFRVAGQFRDISLPGYVVEAMDKHVASHGTTPDGYLFRGREHKLVTRRTYQNHFDRAVEKAGLPPEFNPGAERPPDLRVRWPVLASVLSD